MKQYSDIKAKHKLVFSHYNNIHNMDVALKLKLTINELLMQYSHSGFVLNRKFKNQTHRQVSYVNINFNI